MRHILDIFVSNPIESMLMIFIFCAFYDIKIKLKDFIVMSYIIGFLSYIVQYITMFLSGTIWYPICFILSFFIFAPFFLFIGLSIYKYLIYDNISNILKYYKNCVVVCSVYITTSLILIILFQAYNILYLAPFELLILNLLARIVQFIFLGGIVVLIKYVKSKLIKVTENAVKDVMAPTWGGIGMFAIPEKLKNEIKK